MHSKQESEESSSSSSESRDNQEIRSLAGKPSAQIGPKDASTKSVKSSRRGRPKVPPQWSRIICFDDIHHYKRKAYVLDEDFEEMEKNPLKP